MKLKTLVLCIGLLLGAPLGAACMNMTPYTHVEGGKGCPSGKCPGCAYTKMQEAENAYRLKHGLAPESMTPSCPSCQHLPMCAKDMSKDKPMMSKLDVARSHAEPRHGHCHHHHCGPLIAPYVVAPIVPGIVIHL